MKIFPVIKKFIKYITVGSACTIFDYLTYAFFLYIGFNFRIAVLFSEMLGVFYNFRAQDKVTDCF